MSETYKGGSVPPDLPVRVRKLLEDHDRALTRGVAKETVIVNLIGGGRSPGGGSQPAVAFQVSNVTGTVNRIPPQAAGTMVAFRFPNLPTIKDQTGNIILASGDMEILSKDEILVLSSDGTNWYEISRSRSGATSSVFVPVALWDAVPSITANQTTKIQTAFDNCPAGCTLVFEPGTYICNGANLTRNDLTLYLTGGTIITSNAATAKATINVAGTVDTGAGTSLVQSPGVFDVTYPRAGDRTIYVAAGAEVGFPADSWIWIEDDEVPVTGLPADPELEFWRHGELVRVKSTASGVLNLYTPLLNTYSPETLRNNVLTAGTSWSAADGFALAADTAVYTHNALGGTLTQLSTNFIRPVVASTNYVLTYTITASTVSGGDLTLTGVSSGTVTGLPRTVGTHRTTFTSSAAPGNFVLTATSIAGSFTMDDVYLTLASRIRTVTPVQNFKIFGEGMIQNPQAGTGIAHGIRLFHTVGATIEDITFDQCFDSCLHATRSTEVTVNGAKFQNAVRFDSRGYGFTCHASSRVTVTGGTFKRLRHCIDFSTFSRMCTATGNVCVGSTTGNINTHPSVIGVTISGNVIDGGHGQDAVSPSVEYGDSTVQASGINIDQGNKDVTITGNIIRNMRFSGIVVDFGEAAHPTEYITIDGNVIENCQLYRRVSGAPAMANHAGIALLETQAGGTQRRGVICTNNVLRDPGQYGIRVGVDNALVQGNWVDAAADKRPTSLAVVIGVGIWATPSTATIPSGIILRNNVVSNCTQDGLRVTTDNTTVEGNRSVSNGRRGLFVESTSVATIVRHNYLEGNGEDGINFPASGGFIIGNRGTNNVGFDLRMIAGANNNLVKDNLFSGTGAGTISNAGASNFIVWIDFINDRYGLGTSTPDRLLDLEDSTNPALRLTHTSTTRFADLQANNDGTFGGLCLLPSANAGGFHSVNIFGTNEATGLSIFDDGTDFYLRSGVARGFLVNMPAGQYVRLQQNFSSYIGIDPGGEASCNVPFSAAVTFGSDTVGKAIAVVGDRTGGGSAAGFGAEMQFNLETATNNTFVIAGRWQTFWDTATAAAVDSSMKFIVRDNAVEKEVMRIYGALPGIRIENSTSIGTPNALLDVRGDAIFNEDGAAVNFRVESDTNANMLFVDGTNNSVHVGTSTFTGDIFQVFGSALVHSTTNAKLKVQEDTNGANLLIECPTAANDIRLSFDYGGGVTHRIEADGATGNLLINPRVIGTGIVNIQGKVLVDTEVEIDGALNHDGTTVGFYGATPVTQQTYTITNVTTDRSYDANATTIDELADTLGTLIADLRSVGLVL